MAAQTTTSMVHSSKLTDYAISMASIHTYSAYYQRNNSLVIINMKNTCVFNKAQVFIDLDDPSDTMEAWVRRFMDNRPGASMIIHALRVKHPQVVSAPRGRWFKP